LGSGDVALLLADSLAHDIVFQRVAYGTFALASIISHCSKLEAAAAESSEPVELSLEVLEEDDEDGAAGEEEDDDEAGLTAHDLRSEATEEWVITLQDGDYNDLDLQGRVKVCGSAPVI